LSISSIYEEFEVKSKESCYARCRAFLEEYFSVSGEKIDLSYYSPVAAIRKIKEIKSQDHLNLFFDLLVKYNYNMLQEIKDAVFKLGYLQNPSHNSEAFKELLASPYIQDISFDGRSKFIITSEMYGKFAFELADYYFKKNRRMMGYMYENKLPTYCHNHAFFMSEVFRDFHAITSLCKSYFGNTYYHSYTLDSSSNLVVDLCYRSVIDADSYMRLFEPTEISKVLNSSVKTEFLIAQEKTGEVDKAELLTIALYKQYLQMIGYRGDIKSGPSIKKVA